MSKSFNLQDNTDSLGDDLQQNNKKGVQKNVNTVNSDIFEKVGALAFDIFLRILLVFKCFFTYRVAFLLFQ